MKMIEHDYDDCEHLDGSVMGKCAICGKMVCSECYRTVYNQMICNAHETLEEESAWEVIGFYSESDSIAAVRFDFIEQGLTSLVVEADADTIELYVPPEEKDDAWESVCNLSGDFKRCNACRVHYSTDIGICPICGVKPKSQ